MILSNSQDCPLLDGVISYPDNPFGTPNVYAGVGTYGLGGPLEGFAIIRGTSTDANVGITGTIGTPNAGEPNPRST